MRAMLFSQPGQPLVPAEVAAPQPGAEQVLLQIRACAVCRTDLHVVDGELPEPKRPLIPGHEIVGTVLARGAAVSSLAVGDRVGVPWLGWTCGRCDDCLDGRENLCQRALFTGYTLDGGFAEQVVADARYCFKLPAAYSDVEAAPLLCAGLIGYRALRFVGGSARIGIYGFGAAAHIITQVARHEGREIFAFTRPGDGPAQRFARDLGAVWAGGSDRAPPAPLDAAILFAPIGALVPAALSAVRRGGIVVCAGIHMSDIPSFPYHLLWGERVLRSVANLTRSDGEEFLRVAPAVPVRTHTVAYPLAQANQALEDLRNGHLTGAAVLVPAAG
jgi:propanol-preferring alcohol dehydrogenase